MANILIATYSRSGKTKGVAQMINNLLDNVDMYQIEVAPDTFDRDMYKTDEIATTQIKNNEYPELINEVPNVDQYDLILVGSPVWRGAPATPVHTFLEKIQSYSGKVASFYTDAGTANGYEETFKQWAGKLNVLPAHEGSNDLAAWIKELN
ncbi:NAD(P)H-dependent oxidoreductase [Limosilactobacillus reuteri]|uniref:flavodoxin family protein n=1 Tax=Limosilactobacillus reuteri TaxID=1598 RepID=UPI001E4FC994|nr:flavodoxin [Limosilactobacillus reuteri]MCC4347162.1 NAD(P)H-dependent oxidoreductase [Limosilactobacillus reuteri]MCC4374170.1 NAD(P)H-dependent oxidoreductase [Limosilactobacillus reuteri]MCC4384575.1 NAD(P)H-dependent oxidoreductase [Limosilactobacillus reuteri]